jgi:hypothetical protein
MSFTARIEVETVLDFEDGEAIDGSQDRSTDGPAQAVDRQV